MKNLVPTIAGLFLSFSLFAQLDSFDISQYKLADFDYRQLNTKYNFGGNAKDFTIVNFGNAPERTKSLSFDGDFRLNFLKQKNRRAFVENHSGSFYSLPSYFKQDTSSSLGWSNGGTHLYNKAFYNSKNQFIKIGERISIKTFINNRKPDSERFFEINSNFPISIGIGRIENVTDVWRSVRQLQDLKRLDRLNFEPSDSLILRFAELLTKRRRNRFFDQRLDRIDDLKTVDAFLKEEGILTKDDIGYFTSLSDQWGYGANANRSAGKLFHIGIQPEYDYEIRYIGDSITANQKDLRLSAFFKYQSNKPLNQFWQFNHRIAINSGIAQSESILYERQASRRFLRPEVLFALSYYPNTRTEYEFSLYGNYYYQVFNTKGAEAEDFIDGRVDLNATIYHYLSPQTRITGTCRFLYYESIGDSFYGKGNFSSRDINRYNTSVVFNIGLEYFLF